MDLIDLGPVYVEVGDLTYMYLFTDRKVGWGNSTEMLIVIGWKNNHIVDKLSEVVIIYVHYVWLINLYRLQIDLYSSLCFVLHSILTFTVYPVWDGREGPFNEYCQP